MAPRKRKPTTVAAVAEHPPTRPAMTYITNPVTVARITPKTRDDIALRDAVRKALVETEEMVGYFLADQTAEGFSLAEIYWSCRLCSDTTSMAGGSACRSTAGS